VGIWGENESEGQDGRGRASLRTCDGEGEGDGDGGRGGGGGRKGEGGSRVSAFVRQAERRIFAQARWRPWRIEAGGECASRWRARSWAFLEGSTLGRARPGRPWPRSATTLPARTRAFADGLGRAIEPDMPDTQDGHGRGADAREQGVDGRRRFDRGGHARGQNPISWTGFDPLLPFKIGPMNGRKARESGPRLKAWVAERPFVTLIAPDKLLTAPERILGTT